jgi:hypothetical protein
MQQQDSPKNNYTREVHEKLIILTAEGRSLDPPHTPPVPVKQGPNKERQASGEEAAVLLCAGDAAQPP